MIYPELNLFIGGEWLRPDGRRSEDVLNPASGEPVGRVPHASRHDLDAALASSMEAFLQWRRVSPVERGRILKRAADLIRERTDELAPVMTLEQGKVLGEARLELRAAADTFEWFAEEGRRAYGRVIAARDSGHRQLVVHEPVGPVAAFTPWNFPALTPARKIAGALAAGCSCIIKPSEETPATGLALARALADAGLPKGVLNVVFGVPAEISEYLLSSPIIRKITFTGSTAVGKQLGALAAAGVKRATLELGGHAPVIVFDDSDVAAAADMLAAGKFRNAGQICIAPTRFYVQEQVYEDFTSRFTEGARRLAVGDGLDSSSTMGPLANPRRVDAMESLISDARGHGGKVMAGGSRIGNAGYFWQPTVLAEVPNEARMMNEEPFGPVAIINPFRTFDEVVGEANRLPYGLAAYAFTESGKTAIAVGDALESGMVGINTLAISTPEAPFGGVKESGYGSESGQEGLAAFMSTKFISQR